jgi:anaerobic selenocysteine-containing dehydrogenase
MAASRASILAKEAASTTVGGEYVEGPGASGATPSPAASGRGGASLAGASSDLLLTSCPRDCYDACGIQVRRDGERIVSVRGNPKHPVNRGTLCAKCSLGYNGVWRDPEARLRTPLRRSGPKGSGRFERTSWHEALGTIAQRLRDVAGQNGPEAILHTHYSGTISLLASSFPMRFFHRLGASEVEPDSICNLAGHIAWHLLFGTSAVGFDPRTADDAACILVWGANPAHTGPHVFENWLVPFQGSVVVVDPIRTETTRRADVHLQPFPGSDAALAFSLLHVLEREGALDDEFIAAHTQGADEVLARLPACDPKWGEARTGVPAEKIEQAARLYARGPSLLWAGQGFQRQRDGGNAMRAVGLLPALTGNVGRPGAGFYYLNFPPAIAGADPDWLEGAHLAGGEVPKVSHMGLARRLEDPNGYRAFLCWNTNPLASAPDQAQLRQALAREDLFSVVIDCFQTDTADHADYVLPAASFLEFDDITFSYMNLLVGAQAKVMEPIGESLPNTEIFRRLAGAMGFEEPELFASDRDLIDALMRQMDLGIDFAGLRERGFHAISPEPLIFHEALEFETPSGRIEIASEQAEVMGLHRVPEPRAAERPADGRLRLLTPASKWRLNDTFANDAKARARSGDAEVVLHPDDAARIGVRDGARVRLSNEAGALELTARVRALAPVGVAISYKGRWPRLEGGANVNAVHPGVPADMGESSSVHGTDVEIVPA